MSQSLDELLETVEDEASFVRFLLALAQDFEADRSEAERLPPAPFSPGPRGWENGTINAFLEAAAAWAEASRTSTDAVNPWHRCAQILFAGKHYE